MLDKLSPRPGARKAPVRAGRGPGGKRHKTAGRGVKGQGTRSAPARFFEGGQMPLARRLPKRGFHNIHREPCEVVNLKDLAVFGKGAVVDVDALVARGLVRRGAKVKLLGKGEAPARCTVKVHGAGAGARAAIEAGGGSVEIVS